MSEGEPSPTPATLSHMRKTVCDNCQAELPNGIFEMPDGWLTIEEDDDEHELCSWNCAATFSANKAIEAELGAR